MSRRTLNPQRVKIHLSYTVEEAARLQGAHKNTIRNWIREGLPVLPGCRPTLIHGRDLKSFLQKRRQSVKQACGHGRLYCVKCRGPQQPAEAMVDYDQIGASWGVLRALCPACGTLMHSRVSGPAFSIRMPTTSICPRKRSPSPGPLEMLPSPPWIKFIKL